MMAIPWEIVIVISEALVFQHGRLAKKYLYISSGNRRKVQLKMNENKGVDAGTDYFW
ncbi:hypothetical protein NMG26_001836 [Salmonella enterica subsp. enterica serovar Ajiobo]|nr:hypothetical protein [Salmonella enterica subsp. enterica serovar Ajiobo]EJL3528968.1 hypothetical protein [Salmonella enterica subsp. enterica serovar Ajiobo]